MQSDVAPSKPSPALENKKIPAVWLKKKAPAVADLE
jgi:hypothetical protein